MHIGCQVFVRFCNNYYKCQCHSRIDMTSAVQCPNPFSKTLKANSVSRPRQTFVPGSKAILIHRTERQPQRTALLPSVHSVARLIPGPACFCCAVAGGWIVGCNASKSSCPAFVSFPAYSGSDNRSLCIPDHVPWKPINSLARRVHWRATDAFNWLTPRQHGAVRRFVSGNRWVTFQIRGNWYGCDYYGPIKLYCPL